MPTTPGTPSLKDNLDTLFSGISCTSKDTGTIDKTILTSIHVLLDDVSDFKGIDLAEYKDYITQMEPTLALTENDKIFMCSVIYNLLDMGYLKHDAHAMINVAYLLGLYNTPVAVSVIKIDYPCVTEEMVNHTLKELSYLLDQQFT